MNPLARGTIQRERVARDEGRELAELCAILFRSFVVGPLSCGQYLLRPVLKFNDSEPNELHVDKFAFVGFVAAPPPPPPSGTRSIYPRTGYELWKIRIRRDPLSISRHRRVANVSGFPRIPGGFAITIGRVVGYSRTVESPRKSQTCAFDATRRSIIFSLIKN